MQLTTINGTKHKGRNDRFAIIDDIRIILSTNSTTLLIRRNVTKLTDGKLSANAIITINPTTTIDRKVDTTGILATIGITQPLGTTDSIAITRIRVRIHIRDTTVNHCTDGKHDFTLKRVKRLIVGASQHCRTTLQQRTERRTRTTGIIHITRISGTSVIQLINDTTGMMPPNAINATSVIKLITVRNSTNRCIRCHRHSNLLTVKDGSLRSLRRKRIPHLTRNTNQSGVIVRTLIFRGKSLERYRTNNPFK